MSFRRHVHTDPLTTAEACASHIVGLLEDALSGNDIATLAVSGGSTPSLLFDEMVKARFRWDRVHLFFVDERAVPPTDEQSNYRLAEDHLIAPAHVPHRNVHRVHAEMTPDLAARRYVDEIRSFFGLAAGELPHFDVVQLGIGPDCHTASLFPGEPLIADRSDIAAAVYAEAKTQWRITLLPGTLLAAKHAVFLVTGADKAEALRLVIEGEYEPMNRPAQVVAHRGRCVAWFVDEAAAAERSGG